LKKVRYLSPAKSLYEGEDKTQEVRSLTDEQIIHLFFTRNEDAIQQTAYQYGRRLTMLAANIAGNTEDAEESVNDTYLKAWDTIPPTRPEHFFAYLAKICRRFSLGKLDWNNAAKRKAEVVTLTQEMENCIPGSWLDADLESRELSRILSDFLRTETKENRMIFVRRYWYADTLAEIAQRYAISERAVAMRLHRTRDRLAKCLKKEGISV